MSQAIDTAKGVSHYRPYATYKPSGVEWLGKIPHGWSRARFSDHVTAHPGYPFPAESFSRTSGYPLIRIGDLDSTTTELYFDGAREPSAAVKSGDLLLAMSGDWRLHRWAGGDALLNQRLSRLQVQSGVDSQFLLYALSEPLAIAQEVKAATTLKHLLVGDFKSLKFARPPLSEQRAIAKFLDRETGKIDALIAKKERLIELLQEKRTALITHAVTKGLNPDAPTKPSGVEWLGEIPAHWKPMRLGHLFRQAKRQGHQDLTVLSVYRDYGVIEKESRGDNSNKTPDNLASYQLVAIDDLVINKMKAWQGSLGVAQHRGITSPDYIVYTPTHGENPRFMHHLLRDKLMADVYRSISNGIRPAQWRLEPGNFEALTLFLPPNDEQEAICRMLDTEDDEMATLIEKCKTGVRLSREFRTALISAAVTGKIDVREEVA